ncbi:hypothetical protein, partial [Klebsiella pneumoniae]|uniref:hypothetical protein n=1 Tax=Klebsiella pneumoniae TaxID=573 RepID=UPI0025A22186
DEVDIQQRRLRIAETWLPWDELVFATGSRPFIPPLPGIDRPHQFIPVDFMPLGVPHQPCVAVDARHRLAEAEFNTVFNKEIPG